MLSRALTAGLVGAWYSSNIGVLLLNKYLLSNYGFRYPMFLTMCHMAACALYSYAGIAWLKVVPMQAIRSRVQLLKIGALSAIFCTSVVGGNISLRYLPVSFNQAVGATTPFFTAVFAYLMTIKREAWLTYATLVPVVTGVIIASGLWSLSEGQPRLTGVIEHRCRSYLSGFLLLGLGANRASEVPFVGRRFHSGKISQTSLEYVLLFQNSSSALDLAPCSLCEGEVYVFG